MPQVEYLPPQADVAEVCAWLLSRAPDMARYFPGVSLHCIDGVRMYHDNFDDLLSDMNVISEDHRALIVEGLTHIRGQFAARSARVSQTAPSPSAQPVILVSPSSNPSSHRPSRIEELDLSEVSEAEDAPADSSPGADENKSPPGGLSAMLACPAATARWQVVREGFLRVRDGARRLSGSFRKRVYCTVLRVSPTTLEAQLEIYKGRVHKDSLSITGAVMQFKKSGALLVTNGTAAWTLSDDDSANMDIWHAALQMAATARIKLPRAKSQVLPRRASLSDVVWGAVPKAKDYHIDFASRELTRMVDAVQLAEARARAT